MTGEYYATLMEIKDENAVLKARFSETSTFYVYGHDADVLITDTGITYSSSPKLPMQKSLMEFLQNLSADDVRGIRWSLLHVEEEDYIISWYTKKGRSAGCIMRLNNIFNMYLLSGGILERILNMQVIFVLLIIVLMTVCILEIYSYYQRVMEPLRRFTEGLDELQEEQMLNEDGSNNLLELESANSRFKDLLRKIQSLKIAIYERELNEQRVELEYTQEQILPYFFLNCLSLIHGIADIKGEKEILGITESLSEYMQYIFKDSGKIRMIGEELEHIRAYAQIQKLRYGDEAFSFEIIADGDVDECQIPSLLIPTLVENAFVHGVTLDSHIEISLYITIEHYGENELLYICVSDTGKGFSTDVLKAIEDDTPIIYNGRKHVGLQNIRRRLALIYGEKANIVFSNMDADYGAVVELRIPTDK